MNRWHPAVKFTGNKYVYVCRRFLTEQVYEESKGTYGSYFEAKQAAEQLNRKVTTDE